MSAGRMADNLPEPNIPIRNLGDILPPLVQQEVSDQLRERDVRIAKKRREIINEWKWRGIYLIASIINVTVAL